MTGPLRHPSPGRVLATLLACALALAMFAWPGASQGGQGVGVAPTTLPLDDPPLLRGGSKTATLHFQQHDHDSAEVQITVQPPTDGSADASAWTSTDPSGVVDVPRMSEYPVEVTVRVPDTAANGLYAARVNFRVLAACTSEGACVGTEVGATSIVRIAVGGDEVKRLEVQGSPVVHDAEQGGAFQFSVPLANTGNVDARPAVRVDIWDKHQTTILLTHWFNDTVLSPGATGYHTFILPGIALPMDQYWAVVSVHLDGILLHTAQPHTFDIVEPGALARKLQLRTLRIEGDLTRAKVGDLVKITAVVSNLGEAPVPAVFKGEVWVDGKLADVIASDPLEVPIGEDAELDMFYRLEKAGRHEFKGHAQYATTKVTEEKSLLLAVEAGDGGAGALAYVVAGAAALVIVATVTVVVLRRRQGSAAAPLQRRRPPGTSARRSGSTPAGRATGRPQPSRTGLVRPQPPPRGPPRGR